ncbi:NACHT domain-containing protein, partial [Actinomadura fibrosa]|uniref:NACHT domain-containing protein n=1 Tax=Actinomadura fibrosa TaxID=111802 RepID=UPI001040FCEC
MTSDPPGPAGPPDPGGARSPAEFVRSLTLLRQWAGDPSLRRLRSLGGQVAAADGAVIDALPQSTTSQVLRQADRLPRWDFVRAFVTACLLYCDHPADRIPAEVERWRAARTALIDPITDDALDDPADGAAEVAASERAENAAAEAADGAARATGGAAERAADGLEPGGRGERDPALALLARRVAREEDRARKGLLGGHSIAPVTFATHAGPDLGGVPEAGAEPGAGEYEVGSIGRFFEGLRPQRLMVVGGSGGGKTVLAIELVLRLVEPMVPDEGWPEGRPLVPVRLNAARWTSDSPFEPWLSGQLVQEFGLSGADAERLVRNRRVLPVVDGLDELDPEPSTGPPRRAIGLLTELNRYSDLSGRHPGAVVVTCRADRYAQLAEARAGLADASRITLRDLSTEQIGGYLRARWPDGHPCAPYREGIGAALSGPSGTAVRAALATPWRLLLTATAVESGADPAELLRADPDADPDKAAEGIARRLLDAYIPAATALAPRAAHSAPYGPDQVRAWLERLSAHLRWQAERTAATERPPPGLTAIDLVPHLLWPIGGERLVRALHGVCCAVLAVIAMLAFLVGAAVDRPAELRDGLGGDEVLTPALMAGWVAIAVGLAVSPWPAAAGGRASV